MRILRLGIIVVLLLIFTSCTNSTEDKIYDEIRERVSNPIENDNKNEIDAEDETDILDEDFAFDAESEQSSPYEEENLAAESILEGTLTILVGQWDVHLPRFAELFMTAHPDVTVVIERLEFEPALMDISQQVALTTRLLANPPDILDTANLLFEKFSFEEVFVDLNPFIDGTNGVSRDNLFDNILRGAEVGNQLFSVPIMVNTDTLLLNIQYFADIGVDVSEMRALAFPQLIEYHQKASALHPEKEMRVYSIFSIMDVFRYMRTYDLGTREVMVDTPQMRVLLELVRDIPYGTPRTPIEFTPERIHRIIMMSGSGGQAITTCFFNPPTSVLCLWEFDLHVPFIFMLALAEHPELRYSHPIHITSDVGEITFRSGISPAILQGSQNQELAWEFVRFAMESTDIPSSGLMNYTRYLSEYFPVNRAMFYNRVRHLLERQYDVLVQFRTLEDALDGGVRKEEMVSYSLHRFAELLEMLDTERRYCSAVMNSLIYPDIYLFMTGQQDVGQTVENIQNRLELYVHE